MLRNYFKIAWRNLTRNKAFSAINILGLAIGVAACVLILQYVTFELSYFPSNPFEYSFLDERFNEQYRADQRFGQVFGLFTALAILVACLGLFGLASFTTAQRTKEIGIRKVLGASVAEIVQMLYREFAVLILVAFVVATPLAWYAISRWLQSYAFRSTIQWWLFALPFALVLLIALLTVSFQSIKAALTNPVTSLRSE